MPSYTSIQRRLFNKSGSDFKAKTQAEADFEPISKGQAQAQAMYFNYLIQQGLALAKNKDSLNFDPQGRVLVDIALTSEQKVALLNEINSTLGRDFDGLEAAMGKKHTKTVTLSLDISHDLELRQKFQQQLARFNFTDDMLAFLDKQPVKSSIIALQQEFHFHINLVTRVYEKSIASLSNGLSVAKDETIRQVNSQVLIAYQQAVASSIVDGELDIARLNKSLDKARKELTPQAHAILRKEIVRHTGAILNAQDLDKARLNAIAEETTATANDVLHTDNAQGLVTLIEGTENTAHHRVKGSDFSHRQLTTHFLNADNQAVANTNTRTQIRTPSPVVKKGLKEAEYIADVAVKFQVIRDNYLADKLQSKQDGIPAAFVYNSHTAISSGPLDYLQNESNGNVQTQSARHILKGMHQYNASQISKEPPIYCFVQNISVNGFGRELNDKPLFNGDLLKETKLMAEMALLHSIHDQISDKSQRASIEDIFAAYDAYLHMNNRPEYFSKSTLGQKAVEELSSLKSLWEETHTPSHAELGFTEQVKMALRQLMASNLHGKHEYAKLVQSLSVFAESASISGCKSGNERAQAINGRVAVLDKALASPDKYPAIRDSLKALAVGSVAIERVASGLKDAIDKEYNQSGLQAANSLISLTDQGASAKVERKVGNDFNTNHAEERSMTNLFQTKAGAMQAHKGLTKEMLNAWVPEKQSWGSAFQQTLVNLWSKITSNVGSTLGALFVTLLAPVIAICAAAEAKILQSHNNKSSQEQFNHENSSLQAAFHSKATTAPSTFQSAVTASQPIVAGKDRAKPLIADEVVVGIDNAESNDVARVLR